MPNLHTTLSEITQTVERPIIVDVVKDLNTYLKTDPSTRLIYTGDTETASLSGDNVDDTKHDREALFQSAKHLIIEAKEEEQVEEMSTTSIKRAEQIPVFNDAEIGVTITPVYANTYVTIDYKFQTPNKSEAVRWRNDMRMHLSAGRDTLLHKLNYHYIVPEVYVNILRAIHKNRSELLCIPFDDDTFREYLTVHSSNKLSVKADVVNKHRRYAVNERQGRIQGNFDFGDVSEVTREDGKGYSVSLTYKFTYMKPIGCTMKYPVIVYNQLLPEEYIVFDNTPNPQTTPRYYNKIDNAYAMFESDNIMDSIRKPDIPIRVPCFDDFTPFTYFPGTGTVMFLTSIVEDDKRTLLNLKDLGDYTFDDLFYEFLVKSELPYVCKFGKSVIHISHYSGLTLQPNGSLTVTDDLDVKSMYDLDLRQPHRVRISLVVDLSLLDEDALRRLFNWPGMLRLYIDSVYDLFRVFPQHFNLLNIDALTELEKAFLMSDLGGKDLSLLDRTKYQYPTMGDSPFDVFEDFKKSHPGFLTYIRMKTRSRKTVMTSGILALKDGDTSYKDIWESYKE